MKIYTLHKIKKNSHLEDIGLLHLNQTEEKKEKNTRVNAKLKKKNYDHLILSLFIYLI